MIDYVGLMLVNMAAGLATLAYFVWAGLIQEDNQHWAPAFAISGLVATVCGFIMSFTHPLPAPYSVAYGEMSVLLGVLFLGAAWALANGWKLMPLGIYALIAGAAAVLLGVRIIGLGLTQMPVVAGGGFILTGLGGLGAGLTLCNRDIKPLRLLGSLVTLGAAALWAFMGLMAYWMHMKPA